MEPKSNVKEGFHPRNIHNQRYDFNQLIKTYPPLSKSVFVNKFGDMTIDFADNNSVKSLNRALLSHYYKVEYWDVPEKYLIPPIPSRVDYIHHVADLVGTNKKGVKCLDVGIGANCIYPILGATIYGWDFVGSDTDYGALTNSKVIADNNPALKDKLILRLQHLKDSVFNSIIEQNDYFDVTICNPPFHDSPESAMKGSLRKLSNLKGEKVRETKLNFGGKSNELWCKGGEVRFITTMINESAKYSKNCGWFTTLVSSERSLPPLKRALKRVNPSEVRIIDMHQGNKKSRILAWRY